MKNFVARFFVVLLLFSLPINRAAGQAQPNSAADLPNPYEVLRNAVKANNPLSGLQQLQRREAEYLSSPTLREVYLDGAMIQLLIAVGEHPAALRLEEQLYTDWQPRLKNRARNAVEIETSPLDNYKPQSAASAIAAAGDKHQIIVVNEEHRTSAHRALTLRLLPLLYAKGFRYFAAETINEEDVDLNKRGYPTVQTGTYTIDPMFADAVRTALKLGFKVVPYEKLTCSVDRRADPMVCQNERERGQAQNIYDRILKSDPNAKILVHAGRGHAAKIYDEKSKVGMMAHHLWQISRIEPFTVDQTELSEFYNRADETPLYRFAANRYRFAEPMVFASPDNKFYASRPEHYNVEVFTPRAEYENGRATWLRLGGLRAAHKLKLKDLNLQTDKNRFRAAAPVLVQAFVAGESADAVPVDQIVLRPDQAIWDLMLPTGDFRVRAIDENGKTLGQYQFKQK